MRTLLAFLLVSLALGGWLRAEAVAEPATVRVPRVVGLRVHEAERRLADAGLAVRLLGPSNGEGIRTAMGQNPAPGSQVRAGAQVRVTYRWSRFGEAPPKAPGQSRQVRVPRLAGLELREAVRRLERAGLGADAIGPTGGQSGRSLVVGQSPAAGRNVTRGATIRITWRYSR